MGNKDRGSLPFQKNDIIDLQITTLSGDGNGVGRYKGQVVFVPFTAPGDRIRARIVKVRSTYAFGVTECLQSSGSQRVPADCSVFGKCGGCEFRHIDYAYELKNKQQVVADALKRLGKLEIQVKPVLASPLCDRYRNKVQLPFYTDANGAIRTGFFAQRSHRVISCEDCKLQPVLLNEIANTVCELLTRLGQTVYDEVQHTGFLRHLYLRHAITTDEVLVCLVASSAAFAQAEEFCSQLMKLHPQVRSVVLNVNGERTNVILGRQCITLAGSGVLHDEMAGVPVALNALSFYQVNTRGANVLYEQAARAAQLTGKETVLDLYCGTGTIGLSMAGQCARLIGVEVVPQAVEDARKNAERMEAAHAEFYCADAQQAAELLAQQGVRADVVILDPPRKGCTQELLRCVADMKPKRIVMVSCNPATAARDTACLSEMGYEAAWVQPVDLFPRTKHIETVIMMTSCGLQGK